MILNESIKNACCVLGTVSVIRDFSGQKPAKGLSLYPSGGRHTKTYVLQICQEYKILAGDKCYFKIQSHQVCGIGSPQVLGSTGSFEMSMYQLSDYTGCTVE